MNKNTKIIVGIMCSFLCLGAIGVSGYYIFKSSEVSEDCNHEYKKELYKESYDSETIWEKYGSWVVEKESTCQETGKKSRERNGYYYHYADQHIFTCEICGDFYLEDVKKQKIEINDVETEIIPVIEHEWELIDGEIVATCTDEGKSAEYKCNMCNTHKGGESIDPLGHDRIPSYSEQLYNYHCANCGYDTHTTSHDPICPECSASAWTAEYKEVQDGMECSRCGIHS